MKNAHIDEFLFDKFLATLESKGIKQRVGTLVDGTFVEVSRQHHKEENVKLKQGEVRNRLRRTSISWHSIF
ncbi:MAG: hypothetical protein LBU65_13010 [Planctomycetaceae bacterium]|nr:hypothetical protein [Planctomycetaceae bacterium]